MFCTACGAKNTAENNFCRQCGHKLEQAPAAKISEEEFDRALPVDEQVASLLERAYRQRKANDLPGAIALCDEALQLRPDSTTAHGLLGQLYEQNGERDKAVAQYERVLQLNPGSIADRVKLDELREGGPSNRTGNPRVVMVDHSRPPNYGLIYGGIGAGLMVLIAGGVMALLLRTPRDNGSNSSNAKLEKSGSTSDAVFPTKETAKGNSGETTTSGGAPPPVTGTSSNSQAPAIRGSNPAGVLPGMPNGVYTYPPIQYVYPPQMGTQGALTTISSPGTARVAQPAKNKPAPSKANAESDQGSERVHLSAIDGGVADPSNVVIRVSNHSDSSSANPNKTFAAAPAGNSGKSNNSKTEPDTVGTIRVTPHNDTGTGAPTTNPPTSDSSARISVGQERMNKMDYAGALAAFRMALSGANDEAGYVYEKMGECYRQRNEYKNAITSYENGLREYKKLMGEGRLADRARDGIRVCEDGIKICASE